MHLCAVYILITGVHACLSSSQLRKRVLTLTERAHARHKFRFLSFDAQHATGVECKRRVQAVKLQWVRRSGKFGGAEAEQKEWNLASLHLAVRDSCWLCVKKSAFSAAQLQKLYHAVVGELHAEKNTRKIIPGSDQSKYDVLMRITWINYLPLIDTFLAPQSCS